MTYGAGEGKGVDADMLNGGGGGFFKMSGSSDPSFAGCVTVV